MCVLIFVNLTRSPEKCSNNLKKLPHFLSPLENKQITPLFGRIMPFYSLSHGRIPTPNSDTQSVDSLEILLKLLNLFELKKELDQPLSPITGLEDLQNKAELTLKTLEEVFEKVSSNCSHWTVNSLFGSTVMASYLEKLIHQASNNDKIGKFTHSLLAEIVLNLSLYSLSLLASINPFLTSLGIISAALGETVVQYLLNFVAVESFAIFTALIRQRLTEYSEFRNFIPEYRMYTNFFQAHQYQSVYNLEILNSQDSFKVFKLIHTLSEVTNRRDLVHRLMKILEKDEIFQQRLRNNFSQVGGIFFTLSKIL